MSFFGPKVLTRRNCLKCGQTFNSEGPGNRICPKCNADNKTLVVTKIVIVESHRKGLVE